MCDSCGCGGDEQQQTPAPVLRVGDRRDLVHVTLDLPVQRENDRLAHATAHDLVHRGILAVNVMGAPGSGKTTVLEMLSVLLGKERIAVIQGDLESDIDKIRLERAGIRAFQINTHSGCHLNAAMVSHALARFPLAGIAFLFIENVGNLVCPAGVQLGQHVNLVVSSTAEGSDKPRKYPHIFRDADAILISKADLAPHVSFDEVLFRSDLARIVHSPLVLSVARDAPDSFGPLIELLERRRDVLLDHHR